MFKMLFCSMAFIFCAYASPVFSQDIGWIDSIEGDSSTIKLIREGRSEPVTPYTPVRIGDQLLVEGGKSFVIIGMQDGKTQRIATAQSPFFIATTGSAPTVSGNVLKWVNGLFSSEAKRAIPQALSAMSARGAGSDHLSVPYLSKRFMLLAAKRPLYLSWSGGQAPYQVKLVRQADGLELIALSGIKEKQIITPTIDLAIGDYSLEISDATQTAYEDLLRVLAPIHRPIFPDPVSLRQLPEHAARLVEASWLGSVENGLWVIEAMQELHELSASDTTAKVVLQRLEQGSSVKDVGRSTSN